jgi:glycerol kinase
MTRNCILSIDQGTTGTTVLVIHAAGRVVARAYSEFTQHYPRPGWVEHDPLEIWEVSRRVVREALDRLGDVQRVAAVGLTNQRETTVLWDAATGAPVHKAVVWQCRRTAERCERLRAEGHEEEIRRRTGLTVDPYFPGTKLEWLLDNVPRARDRADAGELRFGTIDTWLLWKLTDGAVHATDFTNASRTMLFNLHACDWDDAMLDLLRVPRSVLPRAIPSVAEFGTVAAIPELKGVPLAGIAGDQQAALFGQACFEPGTAKNTYGTGCFALMHTGNEPFTSRHGLLTTMACSADGTPAYALEGSVFIAGAAVQWLRDELGIIKAAAETEELARSVPDSAGVVFVPAFVGLGAPYWDAHARGTIFGLTRGAGRAHLARATLESIALQTMDVIDAMRADTGQRIEQLLVDGGASANNFLMQLQADLLGVPVVRPQSVETTALGAAFLAGLGVGLWEDVGQLAKLRGVDRVFQPRMGAEDRDALVVRWREAVERTRSEPVGSRLLAAP